MEEMKTARDTLKLRLAELVADQEQAQMMMDAAARHLKLTTARAALAQTALEALTDLIEDRVSEVPF